MSNNSRRLPRAVTLFISLSALCVCSCPHARAQSPLKLQTKPDGHNPLAHLNQMAPQFGPDMQRRLSASGANLFHLAKVLSDPTIMRKSNLAAARPLHNASMAHVRANIDAMRSAPPSSLNELNETRGLVPINDQSLDYVLSRFAGFTQNETSSAWCGNTIVAGFNDSGADIRTVVEGIGGQSLSGVAVSHNRGRNFVGLPFLNPGPDQFNFLGGDPVVACSDSSHFLYSSLFETATEDAQGKISPLTGIAVNISQDGGITWSSPIATVLKDAFSDFLDKEWLAIDPTNPNNVYVTYTDFHIFGTDTACPDGGQGSISLELVTSKDGGLSWNRPVIIERVCSPRLFEDLSGTQVVVGPHGQVYIAYSDIVQDNVEIRMRTSLDGGKTLQPFTVIGDTATSAAPGVDLQGNFRTNSFPMIAVDRSNGPSRGELFAVWTDGSRNQIQDVASLVDGLYAFGDIVISSSSDGGNTWSAPSLVSPAPADFSGTGRDQFMAGVAVDPSGTLAVCYSDRRNDPNNFLIDHYCSVSHDHGYTFEDIRQTPSSWDPTHGTDLLLNGVYMGDYDAVSSDFTGKHAGLFSTFQVQNNTNPDVFGMIVH